MERSDKFGIVPMDFATLISLYGEYRSPKDKIDRLEKSGKLIRIKRGLYVSGSNEFNIPVSLELIANHIYFPSYVSFETALSYHGIIPERTYTTRSATVKRSRKFETPLGRFEYISVEEVLFPAGVMSVRTPGNISFMIAGPEKALCDTMIVRKGLRLQSLKSVKVFLEQDLRADISLLLNFNKAIISHCAEKSTRRRTELNLLLKYLEQ